MRPAIENPQRCQRCGHLRVEHGAQYPRPCERLDYTWRCTCRSFVQRMATVENPDPPGTMRIGSSWDRPDKRGPR